MKTLFLLYFANLYMPLYILPWFKVPFFLELLSMRLLDLNTAETQTDIKAEDCGSHYLICSRGLAEYFCKHLIWRALCH